MNNTLDEFIKKNTALIDQQLDELLSKAQIANTLQESMIYSVKAGGKRIRPLLVLATLEDLGVNSTDGLAVACSIELIHTYSLIHDDLPSMDDDDYRRGKLTNHKVYGEAAAVLAGDALQALAFENLTNLSSTSAESSLKLINKLSKASGANGMVGGQILDIEGESKSLSLDDLEIVHLNKTGALLSYCVEAGAILAGLSENLTKQLEKYASNIGLAFQIKDDILDITSTTEQLGKTVGSDATSHKSTYPSLLGVDGAIERLSTHHRLAIEALQPFNKEPILLKLFADYIVNRTT